MNKSIPTIASKKTRRSTKLKAVELSPAPTPEKLLSGDLPFKEWSDKEIREENWHDPEWIGLQKPSDREDRETNRQDRGRNRQDRERNRQGRGRDGEDSGSDRENRGRDRRDRVDDNQSRGRDRRNHENDRQDSRDGGLHTSPSTANNNPSKRFQDHQVVHLPYSTTEFEWKPAPEVFPDEKLEVYVKSDEYPDLITESRHLLHSEFMRSFIASIHTMTYLGNTNNFTAQFMSPNFVPTTGDSPWKPWFHIYSNSSAGTRRFHDPTLNEIGKYIVRLYWLGTWRKIYVDDRLPLDLLDNVMLPSAARVQGSDQKTVQLWPYLLAKALLKIASFSWFEDREIVDFDIIHCLTGWMPQKINTEGLSPSEVWNICWAYTDHYTYLAKDPSIEDEELTPIPEVKSSVRSIRDENKNESGEISQEAQEDKELRNFSIPVDTTPTTYYLVARCNDLRSFDNKKIEDFSPCWSHEFLVDQTRDCPLAVPNLTADMENWKRIRWLAWAKKKGIVPADEERPENFHYKLVSAFRQVAEVVVYEQPSKISLDILLGLRKRRKKTKKSKTSLVDPKNKKSIASIKKSLTSMKKSLVSINKGTMSTTHTPRKEDKNDEEIGSDPSFWLDYKKLSSQINTITIYFKPTRMKTKIKMSDLKDEGQWNFGRTKEWTILEYPVKNLCRNEPLYLISESADPQFFIINLAQTGYTQSLEEKRDEKISIAIPGNIPECEFCLASLVKRVKINLTEEDVKDYVSIAKFKSQMVTYERSCSHIVLEKYDWRTDKFGETVTSVNTYGTKSTIVELNPGRTILRLWVKSDSPCVVYLFSDDLIDVGNLDAILTFMTDESYFFENTCHEVSNSFLRLIFSFGSPEFPLQLKEFYRSYKPQEPLTKAESMVVHNTFYELLMELIQLLLSEDEMYALTIFLLKWQKEPRVEYPECFNLCNCYDEEDLEYLKQLEKYIVQIQAFFRGIFDRSIMSYHNPDSRYHSRIFDCLVRIYNRIFSVENRLTFCCNLMRALLAHPNMEKIKEKYHFYNDLENVLTLKEFVHNVKITDDQYVPICRQHFIVNSDEPLLIKITLFCDIDEYYVRVIDNDTNCEIKRYTSSVAVTKYKSNKKGYTVLCYGWSTISKQTDAKLTFATKKEIQQDKLIVPRASTQVNTFYGMYHPNANNIICEHLVQVLSESVLLSANFSSSYSGAIISVKVFDDEGKLLQEVIGKEGVVLPAIRLDYRSKRRERRDEPPLASTTNLRKRLRRQQQAMRSGSQISLGAQNYSVTNIAGKGSRVTLLEDESSRKQSKDSPDDDDGFRVKSNRSRASQYKLPSQQSLRRARRESRFFKSDLSIDNEKSSTIFPDPDSDQSVGMLAVKKTDPDLPRRTPLQDFKFRSFAPSHSVAPQGTVSGSKLLKATKTHMLPYYEPRPEKPAIGRGPKKRMKITYPTVYVIEASVVNDSWPLNFEEWDNLERPILDGCVSNVLTSMREVTNQSSRSSLRSKRSTSSIRSRKSSSSLRRLGKASSSGLSNSRKNQPIVGRACWIMQTMINNGDNVDITRNLIKEKEIGDIKHKWVERDPARMKRGQLLRSDFLRDNQILNQDRPFGEDIHTKRSLRKEDVSTFILPELNLTPYMKKAHAEKRIIKTNAALEEDIHKEITMLEKAEEDWSKTKQKMDDFTKQQMNNFAIVNKWFNGVRKKSDYMMELAMKMKIAVYKQMTGRKFVPQIVDVESSHKPVVSVHKFL